MEGVSSPTGDTGDISELGKTENDCSDSLACNGDSSAGGNQLGGLTCSSLSEGEGSTISVDSANGAIAEGNVGVSGKSGVKVVLRLVGIETEHILVFIGLYEFSKREIFFSVLRDRRHARVIYRMY